MKNHILPLHKIPSFIFNLLLFLYFSRTQISFCYANEFQIRISQLIQINVIMCLSTLRNVMVKAKPNHEKHTILYLKQGIG